MRNDDDIRGPVGVERESYEPPAVVFDEELTAQCSVCVGGTFKDNPGNCLGPFSS